jgi:hypothetical protein
MVEDEGERSRYFDTLFHAAATIGVNTSATIEAAIVDRPCLTVLSERYQATQSGRAHFRHLTDAGFLFVAADPRAAAVHVAEVLAGADPGREARREFVSTFVRPYGSQALATDVFARAVELLGEGSNALGVRDALRTKFGGSGGLTVPSHASTVAGHV